MEYNCLVVDNSLGENAMNIEFFKADENGFVEEVTMARKLSVKKITRKQHVEFTYRFDFPKLAKKDIAIFVYHTLQRNFNRNFSSYVDKILFVPGKKGEVIVQCKVVEEY
jgi:hypothetical protein